MRIQHIQNSFNTGEISPYALGRTDLEKYHNACESLQNYIPLFTGGVTRRPGMRYVTAAMGPSRLVPFRFSIAQAYVLEFGNKTLRFYTNQAQIQSGMAAYQITTPWTTAELYGLKFAQSGDITYIVHPNHPPQKLSRLSDTNWVITQPAFRAPPMNNFDQDVGTEKSATMTPGAISGNGVTFTASAGVFIAGDVGKFIVASSGGHPSTTPITGLAYITAVSVSGGADPTTGAALFTTATADIIDPFVSIAAIPAGSWRLRGNPSSFAAIGNIVGGNWFNSRTLGPGKVQNLYSFGPTALTSGGPLDSFTAPNGTGGTVTYSPPPGVDAFRDLDVGRYILFDGAVLLIKALGATGAGNNSQACQVELLSVIRITFGDFVGNQQVAPAANGTWSLQDPSFTATNGYPTAVCFFQDRLCFAGTAAESKTFWMSVTDDFENFALGSQDDDAVSAVINSGQREEIQWLAPYQGFIACGTLEGEYAITGGALAVAGNGPAITPSNVTSTLQSRYGVANIQPIFVENDLIYIQRAKQRSYQFAYDIYRSVYASKNLNIFHDLIVPTGVKEYCYQQNVSGLPTAVIWMVDNGGNLVGLTYSREQDIYAWHRQITGQDLAVPDTIQSVCAIPNPNGLSDDLWLVVNRQGGVGYTVELFDSTLYEDAAGSVTGTTITTVSGLAYLNGRFVVGQAVAKAGTPPAVLTSMLVSAGSISFKSQLPAGASSAQVGLPFTSQIQTVRLEQAGAPTMQGFLKRWVRAWVRVYASVGLTINGQQVPFRVPSDPMTQGVPHSATDFPDNGVGGTGDVEVRNLGYDRDGRVLIQQTQPLPSTVLALFGSVNIGEN